MAVIISSANYGSGGGGAWDPSVLGSALKLWYRSFTTGTTNDSVYTDAGSTLATNTQTVAQWNNVSSSGVSNANLIGTSLTKPSWVSSGINGHPAVKLDSSSSQAMLSGNMGSVFTTACSVFAVAQMAASGVSAYGRLVSYLGSTGGGGDGDTDTFVPLIRKNSATAVESFTVAGGTGDLASSTITTGVGHTMGVVRSNPNFSFYLDGSVSADSPVSQTITMGSAQRISIGADITAAPVLGTANWNGFIGEFIVTNTALSGTDIGHVHTYLATKYGL
jgi:hypothetical protein